MPVAAQKAHRYALDPNTKEGLAAIKHYAKFPVHFVEDMILRNPDGNFHTDPHGNPILLHDTQKHALTVLGEGFWPICSAGRGVGKTAILSWAQIWWMYTKPTARVPVISVKQDQLKRNVWPEIAKWLDMSLLKEDFVWEKTRIFLKGREQKVFSYMMAGVTKESFQGAHDDFLLSQSDEGSGIPDEVFEAMLGSLTGQSNAAMLFGNPTQSTGFFIEMFEHPTGKWVPIHIPCITEQGIRHPNVTQEFIDYHQRKYGEDSSPYRVYVLGLKPKESPDTLVPWEWVNAAKDREISGSELYRIVWGVDVGRGGDSSALAKRQGNAMPQPVKTFSSNDTMVIVGWLKQEFEDTDEKLRPSEILVDVIGLGAGVVDRGREIGLPIRGVNVSESSSAKRQFSRMRDELWWRTREWFESKACRMTEDADLQDELTAIHYKTGSDGKIKVEGKLDFKKRKPLIGSPNRADAFVLTFAGGLDKIEDHAVDRYKKKRGIVRSWLAA